MPFQPARQSEDTGRMEKTRAPSILQEESLARLLRDLAAGDEDAFIEHFSADGEDAEPPNGDGQSWLLVLLERGMLRAARAAMDQCDVTAPDRHGSTPLMAAAARGFADSCAQLLSTGAYANHPSVAKALALAVKNSDCHVCRILVSFDRTCATEALFSAISRDAACDAIVLLNAGVSADSKIETSTYVRHAVHDAVGRPSIMRALIRNGATVNTRDSNGSTPLSIAAARGDLLTCNLLLDEDAAREIKDARGRSPMFYACANEREAVMKRFLELGESVDTVDNTRRTPLFFTAGRGNVSACRTLLRYKSDLFHKDASKWTAFHVAASLGHKNVCRVLMEELKSSNVVDSVLHDHAIDDGEESIICKAMAGPNTWTSVTTATLLRIYCDLLSQGARAMLTKYGTLLIRDFAMDTLMHLAVDHASDAQCIYVLRCLQSIGGVPVMSQNCYRETPLDVARARGRRQVVDVLSGLADSDEVSSFRVRLGGTISRSVGFPNGSGPTAICTFTECSRPRLAQLSRGIESGLYSCSDEIVWQIDTDHGDTVLHFFIRDFCERPGPFPSALDQQSVISTSRWIGCDPRVVRALLTKRNWEGKTPLHVAAELGASGFCIALVERGAHAGEECSAVDKRLIDPPNESTHHWKAINFGAGVTRNDVILPSATSTEEYEFERNRDIRTQRRRLIEYLLEHPDALPSHESALDDVRSKIYRCFPEVLARLIGKMDTVWSVDECSDAQQLYRKFLSASHGSSKLRGEVMSDSFMLADPTGVALHRIFLETEKYGVHVLAKYFVNECIIDSTGDTLLHLVATHGHSSRLSMLRYLLTEGGMDVNRRNKQYKTALHAACEQQDTADVCLFLLTNGADVTAACQNLKAHGVCPWFTPLYSALWATDPPFEVIEMLLSVPMSIVEPRNPRLGRSDVALRGGFTCARWNEPLLRRLVDVHPGALPLFLDHFAVEINRLSGGMLYRFAEVRRTCRDLDLVLRPTTTLAQLDHKYSPSSCATHPVIRNAIHLKWKLFGSRCHRQQLALYVFMLMFFYLANVVLPKIDAVFNDDSASTVGIVQQYKWLDFTSNIDYAVAVCKAACWVLGIYHLVYVELYLEWRADRGRYWRSLWNLLDIGTYILMLATIPLEFCSGDNLSILRECLLGLLSVLLCVNLMQSLLVSSFFSVLIFTFARMCRVVAQFFFHYVLLLVGFAGGFHLLLHGYGPHTNFVSTVRVVFLAMFGELDYLRNFYATDASPARNICCFILLVLYVVVVMIVALNLLTALMTSEYEHVRSQAEERALLELSGALQRYEQWLGGEVVSKLYDSPRGLTLLQACERRIPTENARRIGGASFNGLERWRHRRGRTDLQSLLVDPSSAGHARTAKATIGAVPLAPVDVASDALAAEISRRVVEETAALRVEMAVKLQEILDCVATKHAHLSPTHSPSRPLGRRASARDVAHVDAKLDAVLALLHAQSGSSSAMDTTPAQ